MPPIRHALITGGSRGIGLAIAQALASSGYRITLLARDKVTLRDARSTLSSSHLPSTLSHEIIATPSLTDPKFWTTEGSDQCFGALYDMTNPATKKVDVLVNCAGISQSKAFVRLNGDEMKQIVDTNLTAMMMGTRFLVGRRIIKTSRMETSKHEKESEDDFNPAIINIASLLGVKGGFGAVAYAASKAGVLGFTRALADELGGTGIRVNAIVPGYISTDMTAELERIKTLQQRIPARRFGTPAEVADAALFLARNQYANNCVLNLDGGLSAT